MPLISKKNTLITRQGCLPQNINLKAGVSNRTSKPTFLMHRFLILQIHRYCYLFIDQHTLCRPVRQICESNVKIRVIVMLVTIDLKAISRHFDQLSPYKVPNFLTH